DDAVARERARPVLMEVVRTEAESARAVVADGHGESRDLSRRGLVRNIHEVNILARAFAVGLDGFVRDDEQLSVPERQRGVRVRVAPRSVGPGQRADE